VIGRVGKLAAPFDNAWGKLLAAYYDEERLLGGTWWWKPKK
jgi:hypothetical protein